jgi:diguanylate cyclase (GGDEF)-like protein
MAMDAMHGRGVRLRWLMAMVVLVAALPIFALHLLRLQNDSNAAVMRAYEAAAGLAADGAASHERVTEQARQLLEVLAEIPAVRSATLPECESILNTIRGSRPWLTGIFVTGPDGKGICGNSLAARSLNLSDRRYFQEAQASGRYGVSDVVIGRVSGAHIVVAILPILSGNGEFAGSVGVGISLGWINQVAAEASSKFGGLLIAYDRLGQLIAYQPGMLSGVALQGLATSPAIEAIVAVKATTFEAVDPDGVERLFSVSHIPQSNISVAIGLDRAKILGPIQRSFYRALLFLLLVAALSIGVALAVAEFGLMRGVRALKSAALRLKAGKMGVRVKLPNFVTAELHDLAATYNAMTAEFERLAYLDRLTGLPNRRYLERHMARRDGRTGESLTGRHAVLAIDIDGFKPVNDTHGHAVGDRVLTVIARRIASSIDERGLLFRVGGDEFVAVVPLTKSQTRAAARAIGEDVRQAMEQAIELDGLTFPVACSVGIALVPDDSKSLSGALVIADAALYEAKRTGRNRVVEHAPSISPVLPTSDGSIRQFGSSRMELG